MTPIQEKAYLKISETYKTEKGKKFILHLVRAFLPINQWNRYWDTDKSCCITGKLGFSTNKYFEMTKDSLLLKANLIIDPDNQNAERDYNDIVKKVKEYWNLEEGENLMHDRQLFYSEKSDKCLTAPALIALREFSVNRLGMGDRDMNYTVRSNMYSQVDGVTETQAKAAAKKDSGFKLSTFEVDAFKELAEKFKNQ